MRDAVNRWALWYHIRFACGRPWVQSPVGADIMSHRKIIVLDNDQNWARHDMGMEEPGTAPRVYFIIGWPPYAPREKVVKIGPGWLAQGPV